MGVSPTGELIFEDYVVPDIEIADGHSKGVNMFDSGLGYERLVPVARSLGLMWRACDLADE